jgi:small subunit ribosomal protein S11
MQKTNQYYQYKLFLKQANLTLLKSSIIDELRWKLHRQTFIKEGMFFILHVKSSLTNTLVTLTSYKGKMLFHASCGRLGFKTKKKRKSKFAVLSLLKKTAFRLKEYKGKQGFLFLNGFAKPRYSILKYLKRSQVKLLGIRDVTPKPHHGCRPKKKRRL